MEINQTENTEITLNTETANRFWYALYTKPRHEFKAAEQLTDVSVSYYLPVVVKLKQWSDRKKKVTEPLIRGYIFVHATEKERITALEQNSVVRCVTFNGRVATIPDWQIDNLRTMLETESDFLISEKIQAGQKVKVTSGPFEGVTGLVNHTPNGKTISITIDMLKRSVTAVLPTESVVKVVE